MPPSFGSLNKHTLLIVPILTHVVGGGERVAVGVCHHHPAGNREERNLTSNPVLGILIPIISRHGKHREADNMIDETSASGAKLRVPGDDNFTGKADHREGKDGGRIMSILSSN